MATHWSHLDLVRTWMNQVQGIPVSTPLPEGNQRKMRRLEVWGDTLCSWGRHFPLVVPVRRRGKVVAWCLNGDTWGRASGWATENTTTNHQDAVRSAAVESGLPWVVIPFAALRAAGIDPTTVMPIDRTADRWEEKQEFIPLGSDRISWHYDTVKVPGTDGFVHRDTGQWVARGWDEVTGKWISTPPGRPDYAFSKQTWDEHKAAVKRWEAAWIEVPAVHKRNGHKHPEVQVDRHTEKVELIEFEDGERVYERIWQRHWLGESVVRARLDYRKRVKCDLCHGTKRIAPWVDYVDGAEGPLTEADEYRHPDYERILRNMAEMPSWKPRPRTVSGTRIRTGCHRCRESGRITVNAQRWAYFLSGFDANEPRPSYFFTELPPGEKPTTVAEAYDTLKPRTVALAEELGRTVHRQGDIFLIDTPTLTLKSLKAQGGVHAKRQRLLGTNHTASEVVRVGPLTYARGIIRHEPGGRRPDHVRINVGRSWSLVLGNRTPVGTGL